LAAFVAMDGGVDTCLHTFDAIFCQEIKWLRDRLGTSVGRAEGVMNGTADIRPKNFSADPAGCDGFALFP
jgi:hypothetical protein